LSCLVENKGEHLALLLISKLYIFEKNRYTGNFLFKGNPCGVYFIKAISNGAVFVEIIVLSK
jgi:hypothetical protein